jgi:hypothetical protein
MNSAMHDEEYDSLDEEEGIWYLSRETRFDIENFSRLPMPRTFQPFLKYEYPAFPSTVREPSPMFTSHWEQQAAYVVGLPRYGTSDAPFEATNQISELQTVQQKKYDSVLVQSTGKRSRSPEQLQSSSISTRCRSHEPLFDKSKRLMVTLKLPRAKVTETTKTLSPKPAQLIVVLPLPRPKSPAKTPGKAPKSPPVQSVSIPSAPTAVESPIPSPVVHQLGNYTIIPVWPTSDGIPSARVYAGFTRNDLFFESCLAVEYMKLQNIPQQPGVKYKLDRLPAGYSGWESMRPDGRCDRQSLGHPSGKRFFSLSQLWMHLRELAAKGSALGCGCKLCKGRR